MEIPDAIQRQFDATAVNRHLGFRLLQSGGQCGIVEMEPGDEHLQEKGIVHGGLLSALADTAAVYALFPDLLDGQSMTSIEFKVNFLRPVTRDGGCIRATSGVIQRGRRIGVCEVDVVQAGKAVARGTFTYLFFGVE